MQEKLKITYEVCLLSENPIIQTYVQPLKNRKFSFTENLNRKVLGKKNFDDSFLFVCIIDVIQIFNENGILKTVKCNASDHIYGLTVLSVNDKLCCLLLSTNKYQYSLYKINVSKSKKIQKNRIKNEIFHIKNENYSSDEQKEEIKNESDNIMYDINKNENKNKNENENERISEDGECFISKIQMKSMCKDNIFGNSYFHYPYIPFCESILFFPHAESNFTNHVRTNTDKHFKKILEEPQEGSSGRPLRILGHHSDFGYQLLESLENYDENFNLISTEKDMVLAFPEVLVPFNCASFGHFDDINISKCKKVLPIRGTRNFFITRVSCPNFSNFIMLKFFKTISDRIFFLFYDLYNYFYDNRKIFLFLCLYFFLFLFTCFYICAS